MTEKKIVAIDSQKLDAIQSCSYFYNTKFVQNLVPINTPMYLERGGLLHEMLSVYYNCRKYRARWRQNKKSHADVVNSAIITGRHFANKMQIDISEVENTIDVFRQYCDHWENDAWDNILGVEQVGAKILYDSDDLTILYEVKIDLILQMGNAIVAVDHKHSSSRRDPNELSNQFKGYCWFLGTNNFIVNEVGFQKTVKPVDKFRRHTLSFPQAIIDEWRDNAIFWIRQQLAYDKEGYRPRNYTSCDKFSGCDLKHICLAEPGDLRNYRLRQMFTERKWDVGGKHL